MKLPTLLRPAVALLGLLPAWCAAASIGIVTIVDGDLAVLRDTQRFSAAEGVRVRTDDILRTGTDTKLARVELADGSTLDLGPDTELMLQPHTGGGFGERAATLYLARGWLKIGTSKDPGAAGVASATLDLQHIAGTVVLRIAPGAAMLFVEAGTAQVAELQEGRVLHTHSLQDGDTFVKRASESATLARRPPVELLQGLPRGFVDSLPRRAARFQANPVEPAGGTPVAYAEVSRWLNGEAPLRSMAVPRFTPRATDRAFRASLVAELRAHPEWDRVLFPEKYRPKPVVVANRTAPAASAPAAAVPSSPAPVTVSLQGLMSWPSAARDYTPNPLMETR
jgi:hypothetical protein